MHEITIGRNEFDYVPRTDVKNVNYCARCGCPVVDHPDSREMHELNCHRTRVRA